MTPPMRIQPVPPCYVLAEMEEKWTGRKAQAARVRKQISRLEKALKKAS